MTREQILLLQLVNAVRPLRKRTRLMTAIDPHLAEIVDKAETHLLGEGLILRPINEPITEKA